MIAAATSAMFAGSRPFRTGSSATNQSRYGFLKNPLTALPTLLVSQAPGDLSRSWTSRGLAIISRSSVAVSPPSIAATASRNRVSRVPPGTAELPGSAANEQIGQRAPGPEQEHPFDEVGFHRCESYVDVSLERNKAFLEPYVGLGEPPLD